MEKPMFLRHQQTRKMIDAPISGATTMMTGSWSAVSVDYTGNVRVMGNGLDKLLGSNLVPFLDNPQKPLAHDIAQRGILFEKHFYLYRPKRDQLTGFTAEGVGSIFFTVQ